MAVTTKHEEQEGGGGERGEDIGRDGWMEREKRTKEEREKVGRKEIWSRGRRKCG